MTLTTQEKAAVCRRAAELVRGGSCRGTFARNAQGNGTAYWGDTAVRWCVSGALKRACSDVGAEEESSDILHAIGKAERRPAVSINDSEPSDTARAALIAGLLERQAVRYEQQSQEQT